MNPKALYSIGYGVYLITSKKGDKLNGQTANALIQVTAEPPAIAIGINKQNLTHEYITQSKIFAVSILSQDTPLNFIGQFGFKSGRDINKFDGVNFKIGRTGAPIVLDNTLGYLEVKVTKQMEVGTHTIFVGEVVEADVLKDGVPMSYVYYHQVKRGTTPKTAPTYRKEEVKSATAAKYQCKICGYLYDPEKGDSDGGIAPGIPFEKLPDSWTCPVCGASKDQFEKA